MLVLSRKLGEKIQIGDDVTITLVDIERGKVRIGVQAPRDVVVLRSELVNTSKGDVLPRCKEFSAAPTQAVDE